MGILRARVVARAHPYRADRHRAANIRGFRHRVLRGTAPPIRMSAPGNPRRPTGLIAQYEPLGHQPQRTQWPVRVPSSLPAPDCTHGRSRSAGSIMLIADANFAFSALPLTGRMGPD